MPLRYSGGVPRNVPQKPQPRRTGSTVFPSDLITGNRRYYIQIEFANYRSGSFSNFQNIPIPGIGTIGGGQTRDPRGGVILPVPSSLADVSILNWEQRSLVDEGTRTAASIFGPSLQAAFQAGSSTAAIVGAYAGVTVNPGLFMVFTQPNFKEYVFNWDLVANNEDETRRIADIVNSFKFAAAPASQGFYYDYPDIAIMKLFPKDYYTFVMKPAAITAVRAQYNGAGQPAFLRNGAPVNVKLTVQFKEIQIWEKFSWSRGTS
jgi:hypothetical protein